MILERHRSVDKYSGFTPNTVAVGLEVVTGNLHFLLSGFGTMNIQLDKTKHFVCCLGCFFKLLFNDTELNLASYFLSE